MDLDIYAGPLCRFWSGDWGEDGPRAAPVLLEGEPGQALRLANAHRDDLEAAHGAIRGWTEALDAPCRSAHPGWMGWRGLQLLARTVELQQPMADEMPTGDVVDLWPGDGPTMFLSLLAPTRWLPIDLEGGFAPILSPVDPEPVVVGSLDALLEDLFELNRRTFGLVWLHDLERPSPEAPVADHARYGLTIALQVAKWAGEHRAPISLHP